jgi:FMN phosphatase YigB (HAD superfamily)
MSYKAIIFDWVGTLYERDVGLFPDVEIILRNLHSTHKLGLISKRKNPAQGHEELNKLGLANHFDSIIIATKKTQIEFKKCIKELGVFPEEILVVGDRTIREIRIGNILGCDTAWIKTGEHADEKPNRKTGLPTYIINSLKELSCVFNRNLSYGKNDIDTTSDYKLSFGGNSKELIEAGYKKVGTCQMDNGVSGVVYLRKR